MKFEKPKKKSIDWYGKQVNVPFDCQIYPEKEVKIANRFSGQSIKLPEFAAVVYDKTIELNLAAERKDVATGQEPGFSEHQKDWQKVRAGINFFRQYFAAEYMVLLD